MIINSKVNPIFETQHLHIRQNLCTKWLWWCCLLCMFILMFKQSLCNCAAEGKKRIFLQNILSNYAIDMKYFVPVYPISSTSLRSRDQTKFKYSYLPPCVF